MLPPPLLPIGGHQNALGFLISLNNPIIFSTKLSFDNLTIFWPHPSRIGFIAIHKLRYVRDFCLHLDKTFTQFMTSSSLSLIHSVYKPRRFRARDKSGLGIQNKIGLKIIYNTISPLAYARNHRYAKHSWWRMI